MDYKNIHRTLVDKKMLCGCLWVYKNKTKKIFGKKEYSNALCLPIKAHWKPHLRFILYQKRIQIRFFSKLKALPKAYQF